MRLAETLKITLRGEQLVLRPTLRAAILLSQHYEIEDLLRGVIEGNSKVLTDIAMATLVEGTVVNRHKLEELIIYFAITSDRVLDDFLNLTLGIIGTTRTDFEKASSDEDDDDSLDNHERMTFAETTERLFMIATGYIGWTPEQTYNAAPREIVLAYQGRLEMFSALFGGTSKAKGKPNSPDANKPSLDDQIRRVMAVQRQKASKHAH